MTSLKRSKGYVEQREVIIHFVVIKSKWVRGGGGRLEGTNCLRHRFSMNTKENIEPGL